MMLLSTRAFVKMATKEAKDNREKCCYIVRPYNFPLTLLEVHVGVRSPMHQEQVLALELIHLPRQVRVFVSIIVPVWRLWRAHVTLCVGRI